MTLKLIAVASIGLLAGACSLNPLGTPTAYSSRPAANESSAAVAQTRRVSRTAGFGPVTPAPREVMPGDLIGPTAPPRKGAADPVASLKASAQARSHWATLRPGELTRPPLLESRLIQALAGIGRTDVQTGSVHASEPAPKKVVKRARQDDLYDREAAMQRLIESGRFKTGMICEGC